MCTRAIFYRSFSRAAAAVVTGLMADGLKTLIPNCFGVNVSRLHAAMYESCGIAHKVAAASLACFNRLKSFAIDEHQDNRSVKDLILCSKPIHEFSTQLTDVCQCAVEKASEAIPLYEFRQLLLSTPSNTTDVQTSHLSFMDGGYPRYTVMLTAVVILDIVMQLFKVHPGCNVPLGALSSLATGYFCELSLLGTAISYLLYRGAYGSGYYCVLKTMNRQTEVPQVPSPHDPESYIRISHDEAVGGISLHSGRNPTYLGALPITIAAAKKPATDDDHGLYSVPLTPSSRSTSTAPTRPVSLDVHVDSSRTALDNSLSSTDARVCDMSDTDHDD